MLKKLFLILFISIISFSIITSSEDDFLKDVKEIKNIIEKKIDEIAGKNSTDTFDKTVKDNLKFKFPVVVNEETSPDSTNFIEIKEKTNSSDEEKKNSNNKEEDKNDEKKEIQKEKDDNLKAKIKVSSDNKKEDDDDKEKIEEKNDHDNGKNKTSTDDTFNNYLKDVFEEKIKDAEQELKKLKDIAEIHTQNFYEDYYQNYENNNRFILKKLEGLNQDQLDEYFMDIAIREAKKSDKDGGVPVGGVLVKDNIILGKGHNLLKQDNSPILHGEMEVINKAGRIPAEYYRNATLYTTLSPCRMCASTISLFQIPRIVVGENKNFRDEDGEGYLQKTGHEVKVLDSKEAYDIMNKFIKEKPALWAEDIGKRVSKVEEDLKKNITNFKAKVDQIEEDLNSQISKANNTFIQDVNEIKAKYDKEDMYNEVSKAINDTVSKTVNKTLTDDLKQIIRDDLNNIVKKLNTYAESVSKPNENTNTDTDNKKTNSISHEDDVKSSDQKADIFVNAKNKVNELSNDVAGKDLLLQVDNKDLSFNINDESAEVTPKNLREEEVKEKKALKYATSLDKDKYTFSFFSTISSWFSGGYNDYIAEPLKDFYTIQDKNSTERIVSEKEHLNEEKSLDTVKNANNYLLFVVIITFYLIILALSFYINRYKMSKINDEDNELLTDEYGRKYKLFKNN